MTALTPAQVRDHARALILDAARVRTLGEIAERLGDTKWAATATDRELDDAIYAIDADVSTARITVDWDEPASPTQTDQEAHRVPSDQ